MLSSSRAPRAFSVHCPSWRSFLVLAFTFGPEHVSTGAAYASFGRKVGFGPLFPRIVPIAVPALQRSPSRAGRTGGYAKVVAPLLLARPKGNSRLGLVHVPAIKFTQSASRGAAPLSLGRGPSRVDTVCAATRF